MVLVYDSPVSKDTKYLIGRVQLCKLGQASVGLFIYVSKGIYIQIVTPLDLLRAWRIFYMSWERRYLDYPHVFYSLICSCLDQNWFLFLNLSWHFVIFLVLHTMLWRRNWTEVTQSESPYLYKETLPQSASQVKIILK